MGVKLNILEQYTRSPQDIEHVNGVNLIPINQVEFVAYEIAKPLP